MSLGKWFLKTFEDTDVDTLQSTIKHLQDEVKESYRYKYNPG